MNEARTSDTALTTVKLAYDSIEPQEAAEAELDEIERVLGWGAEELIELRNYVEKVAAAARVVRKVIDEAIARDLGPNGGIRYGQQYVRAAGTKTFKVTNPDGLLDFIFHHGREGLECFSPASVRIGALKKLAERAGLDAKTIVDSFGEYVDDERPISVVPIDKAPKYVQRLSHGERVLPKGKTLDQAVSELSVDSVASTSHQGQTAPSAESTH